MAKRDDTLPTGRAKRASAGRAALAWVLLVLLALACENGGAPGVDLPTTTAAPPTMHPEWVPVQVVAVVDGDTIRVEAGGEVFPLRYIGIDAPELSGPYTSEEPLGPEAHQANRDLVEGKTVYLEKDVSETDRYGRLLRYVYLTDGIFVNAELLRLGYAQVTTFPPDVRYQSLFLEMQADAREAGRGLWSSSLAVCDCSRDLYACTDFETVDAARACHEVCVAAGVGDVHRLDENGDGQACEGMP
ncbi:MAG: thermonuclease family protein [Anaerolineales bacterium]|nr:thermonuclease family protein [Anaerolineales bacterium]